MSLARDAQSSGDIVAAENYLQHAEHYNRIVMAAQAQFQQIAAAVPRRRPRRGLRRRPADERPRPRPLRLSTATAAATTRAATTASTSGGEGDDDRGYRPPMQQQGLSRTHDNRPRGPRPGSLRSSPLRPGRPSGCSRQDDRAGPERPAGLSRQRQPARALPARRGAAARGRRAPAVEARRRPSPRKRLPPPRRRRGRPPRGEAERAAAQARTTPTAPLLWPLFRTEFRQA